jgi:hypothetical protein
MNVIFWHICGISDYKKVSLEQYKAIESSGLLERVEKVYITYLGNSETDIDFLLQQSDKLVLHVYNSYVRHYERLCLHSLHDFAQENNGNVLYIHSKGVSDRFDLQPLVKKNIQGWREMMEYFLIYQHESCIQLLETYDALGCCISNNTSNNLRIQNEQHSLHFSGNFWWSTCKYIRTLPRIREDITGDLSANCTFHLCERWILQRFPACNYLEVYRHPDIQHFYGSAPELSYREVSLKKFIQ